jgi:ABC-type dipeptide/oligopeptide/nickel transport system permease subunit
MHGNPHPSREDGAVQPLMLPHPSTLRRAVTFLAGRHWLLRLGVVLLVGVVLILVLAPWIAPYDPAAQSLIRRLRPPSVDHWLGTDQLGRDELSRLLWGGRFSVVIATATLLLSAILGTMAGIVCARTGGMLDEVTMRVVDLLLSFPEVIVAIFLVAFVGPGYGTLITALTITGWTPFARLARSLTLEVNAHDYIRAAEVLGCSRRFIIFRHIVPNTARPLLAITFLRFGHKLITVGGLSFLGLGIQPPHADWAVMLAEAQPYAERAPLLVVAPGIAIILTALSVTWIGRGMELSASPRARIWSRLRRMVPGQLGARPNPAAAA